MRLSLFFSTAIVLYFASPFAYGQTGRVCLSSTEARHVVTEQKLLDPLTVMKSAVTLTKAEPLRTRLCRWSQEMIYEVSLLRRDGHVLRVNLRAADGKVMTGRELKEQSK